MRIFTLLLGFYSIFPNFLLAQSMHPYDLANLISMKTGAKIVAKSHLNDTLFVPENVLNDALKEQAIWRMRNRPDTNRHWIVIELPRSHTFTTFAFCTAGLNEEKHNGITANYVDIWLSNQGPEEGFFKAGDVHLDRNKAYQVANISGKQARWVKLVVESNWGFKKMTEIGRIYAYNDIWLHEYEMLLNAGNKIDVHDIQFETNSAEILPECMIAIETIAKLLLDYPDMRLEVQGHTDNDGSQSANVALSKKRAQAVVEHLVAIGIAEKRLMAVGKGASEPLQPNDSEEGKAQNRRVTFKII